jgi:hypothetical protein
MWLGFNASIAGNTLMKWLLRIAARFGISGRSSAGPALNVSVSFGTQTKRADMDIIEIVKPIWTKYAALDNSVQTYCNLFVNAVMLTQDYHGFEGRVANTINDIMLFDKTHWRPLDPAVWKQNTIVVAGIKADPHGHVNILLPGEFVDSTNYKKKVPLCANIGRDNFFGKGINFAFHFEPLYFEFIA